MRRSSRRQRDGLLLMRAVIRRMIWSRFHWEERAPLDE